MPGGLHAVPNIFPVPGGLVHGGLREAAAGSLSSLPAEIEESMLPMFNSQRQTGTGTGGQHPVGVQTSFDSSHFLAPARPAELTGTATGVRSD